MTQGPLKYSDIYLVTTYAPSGYPPTYRDPIAYMTSDLQAKRYEIKTVLRYIKRNTRTFLLYGKAQLISWWALNNSAKLSNFTRSSMSEE